MLGKQSIRRFLSVALVLIGAVLIFFATEAFAGVILVVLGLCIEAAGITIKHK